MPIYEYIKGGKTHYKYAFEVKDQNGNRKTIKKSGFTTKTQARNAEADARTQWNKGKHIEVNNISFGAYMNEWLKGKQDISDQSRYTNEGHLKNHIIPLLGSVPLQKFNYRHIEELVTELQSKGLADGTVRKIYNLVHTAMKSAVKKELISKNPFDYLDSSSKPKTGKPSIEYWSKEEVNQFLSNLNDRYKILFEIAIYTGMRRGEILGLRFKDIDFKNRKIKIAQTLGFYNKTKIGAKTDAGNRSISISKYLTLRLKEHREMIKHESELNKDKYTNYDYVICDEYGKPLSVSNFHKFWTRRLKQTGVRPIRFHALRHTCASLMLDTPSIHPKVVQELLGHSSIKVTLDMYSHLTPNMQANAAEALNEYIQSENTNNTD